MQEFSNTSDDITRFSEISKSIEERELIQRRLSIINHRIDWLMKIKKTLEYQLEKIDKKKLN
ncbi:MAG: hypothetical protein ACTSWC_09870 [Promethearchaeota archaeon]